MKSSGHSSDTDSYMGLIGERLADDSIPCPIAYHARSNPELAAIRSGDVEFSYGQLDRAVRDYADGFTASGSGRGKRNAVQPFDEIHSILTLFAGMRIGASTMLVSTRLPEEALADAVGIAAVDAPVNVAPQWRPEITSDEAAIDDEGGLIDPSIPATMMFTSGSRGLPRAAVHTAANHFSSAIGSGTALPLAPGDAWLLSLPLYHVGGLAIVFRCFSAGATVVLRDGEASLGENFRTGRISHVSLVPTQLARVIAENDPAPASLREVLVGGGFASFSLMKRAIESGYPIRTTYGLTEMASQVATSRRWTDDGATHPAPRVLPHCTVRIDSDREILVRGDSLFMGYLTEEGIDCPTDDDGWFRTGDLGALRDGELTLFGRKDAMFISGGENIQPEEIEREILNCDGVTAAIVVPVSDAEFGQRPVAFVALTDGDFESVRGALERRLPRFKIPDAFFPLTESVSTVSIKSLRSAWQERAAELLRDG